METNQAGISLTALADPTRRVIFEHLVDRPMSVQEIADRLPVSRPAVSQHLKVLRAAGLVVDEADGTRRIYRSEPEGLAVLRDYLDGFWNRSLRAFKRAAEAPAQEQS